jgi:hypothetical protein
MRLAYSVLICTSLAACGTDPVTTVTAADSGDSSSTSGGPGTTVDTPTTGSPTTGSSTDAPTGGSNSMTDGETTTSTTGTSLTTTDATTVGDDSTTMMVQTGSTGPDDTTGSTGTTGPDDTTGSTGSSEGGSESTEGVEACACPDIEVPLDDGIFVLSITAELWKYFPETNTFQELGPIACDLPPATFSMAVDRLGFAWVQFSGGQLRKVAVTDVSDCTDPGYVVGQQGITNFGMAFVSNSAADACDRIYGNRASGLPEGNQISDFFAIDPITLDVIPISKSDYGTAELTGTGDGRTFFFAGANPAKLIEINKANGAKLSVLPLTGVELGNAWAFAAFAGDFYFFTNSKGGPGSEVTHIDFDDSDKNGKQDITVVIPDAPISIVGAGVSTCAPTAPQ